MSVAFAKSRVSVAKVTGARPVVIAHAKAGNWLPGSDSPPHLDGTLAGDYGFDPLKLQPGIIAGRAETWRPGTSLRYANDPSAPKSAPEGNMQRLREAELINGRWAMLGVAGCLAVELAGQGDWFDAPLWAVNGGTASYLGVPVPFDIKTLLLVELIAMAGVEVLRNEEKDPEKRCYPGGAFDPMGFSKDASKLEDLKLKEVKNGRLAMMAFAGFVSQHVVTGKGPLENLGTHLANPGANNFATNGISLPPFAFPFLYYDV